MSGQPRKRRISDLDPPSSTFPLTTCSIKKRRITSNAGCHPQQCTKQIIADFSCSQSPQSFVDSNHHCESISASFNSQCSVDDVDDVKHCGSIYDIPSVIVQHILSFNTPFELCVSASLSTFYRIQCDIMWHRLAHCTISPQLFPTLVSDDYDSQIEYNPLRNPLRGHSTLRMIHYKLKENPCIFRMGHQHQVGHASSASVNSKTATTPLTSEGPETSSSCQHPALYTADLFDGELTPSFQLCSLRIESMYLNLTDMTFQRLLSSSSNSLRSLSLKKRDPFRCSFCHRGALCKWHKCEDCELRSYCSRQCQSEDWNLHQYVCCYHDPQGVLHRLQRDHRLTGGFLDAICRCRNLRELELTCCFMIHHTALDMIAAHCTELSVLKLNGTDVDDDGVMALVNHLSAIEILHVRGARYVSDDSMQVLATKHAKTLRELDVTRCCLITKTGCLKVIESCLQLEGLSMACGVKRGGWVWTMDDELVEGILRLQRLKTLEYVSPWKGGKEQELWMMKGIVIQRISSSKKIELNEDGRFVVTNMHGDEAGETGDENPVLMERIVGGKVVYSHRFRR